MLGKKLALGVSGRKTNDDNSSMWDNTPAQPAPSATPTPGAANPPLKRDLTAMMYGGANPLFGAGALGGDDDDKDDKPSRPDRMFEDDSDEDPEAFLQQLTKPPEEQKVQMTIGAGG